MKNALPKLIILSTCIPRERKKNPFSGSEITFTTAVKLNTPGIMEPKVICLLAVYTRVCGRGRQLLGKPVEHEVMNMHFPSNSVTSIRLLMLEP